MPPTIRPKDSAPARNKTKLGGEWLDKRDKRIIAFGVVGSLLLALGLGFLMFALLRSDANTQDPDLATPVIAPDYPRHLADFSFTDQLGKPVARADLRGKFVVVDFIFTSCSVTCPYVNAQMKKIQEATTGQPVRLLSLTLDPGDDTAPVLARYAPEFGADPTRWSFLTGDPTIMHDFVGISFLPPDTTGQFSYMPGNFAHVQRIVLVDRTGRIVSYFDGLNQNAADSVIAQIHKLETSP